MKKRFALEQDRPDGFIPDAYIVPIICAPVLLFVFGLLLVDKAPAHQLALVVLAAGAVVSLATFFAGLQFRVTLLVGEDGIVVFGNRQDRIFVSHAAILGVEARAKGYVSIERSDGTPLLFRALVKLPRSRHEGARRIVAAVDDAHNLFLASAKTRFDEPLLHRSGRAALDFVHELRELTRVKVETYRSTSFDRDRLWRVAENPSASAIDRIAAFIALRVDATEGDVIRLRESTERAVDEKTARRLSSALSLSRDEDLVDLLDLRDEDEAARTLPVRLKRRRAI